MIDVHPLFRPLTYPVTTLGVPSHAFGFIFLGMVFLFSVTQQFLMTGFSACLLYLVCWLLWRGGDPFIFEILKIKLSLGGARNRHFWGGYVCYAAE